MNRTSFFGRACMLTALSVALTLGAMTGLRAIGAPPPAAVEFATASVSR